MFRHRSNFSLAPVAPAASRRRGKTAHPSGGSSFRRSPSRRPPCSLTGHSISQRNRFQKTAPGLVAIGPLNLCLEIAVAPNTKANFLAGN